MTSSVYFIIGFFAGIATFVVWIMSLNSPEETKKSRKWTKIESITYNWDFDMDFKDEVRIKDIVDHLPVLMANKTKSKPIIEETTVDPGSYTVKLTVNAKFIGREPGDKLKD